MNILKRIVCLLIGHDYSIWKVKPLELKERHCFRCKAFQWKPVDSSTIWED